MNIAIYTLTSALHDPQAVDTLTNEFLTSLNVPYILKGDDFSDYGSHDLNLIFVRTGGTEGIFQQMMPTLVGKSDAPFYLLASDKSNSLAASLEILSYLRLQGKQGEILHGNPEYIASRIQMLCRVESAVKRLRKSRLGVIGKPSDWLIASQVDAECVRQKLGVELLDIPMSELLDTLAATPESSPTEHSDMPAVNEALPDACRIYEALKIVVQKHDLQGFTIRCFDLLDAVHNTGCWALAKLNAEGYIAGCDWHVLFPSEPRQHPSRNGRNPLRPLHHTLRYGSALRTGHAFRIGNRGRHPRLRAGRSCHDLQSFGRFVTSVRRGRRAGSMSDKAGPLPHAVDGAPLQSVRHRILSDESYWESPCYHSRTARRSTESVVTEMFHLLLEYLSR